MTDASHDQLASVVREHAGQLAAALMRVTGDFATAEDLVQDAVLAALQHWPAEGIPDRPDAWLFTVARRRALDGFRRADNYRAKLAQLQWPVQPAEDERLRLIFSCCHPALPRPAQVALTLHAEAERFQDTDWAQIVLLYDMLLHLAPSPVTRLHRAIAVRYATGARAAMAELDDLAEALGEYHLYHATRAELLRELSQPDQARAADRRALDLTANPAEQAVLQHRLAWM